MKFRLRSFRRDEDGGMTVETVLWIPFILFMVLMVLDAALIFMNYARAQRFVHQANRSHVVGEFTSCTQTETWLETELQAFIASADATCGQAKDGTLRTLQVTMNTGDMDLTGATGFLGGMTVSVGSLQKLEVADE